MDFHCRDCCSGGLFGGNKRGSGVGTHYSSPSQGGLQDLNGGFSSFSGQQLKEGQNGGSFQSGGSASAGHASQGNNQQHPNTNANGMRPLLIPSGGNGPLNYPAYAYQGGIGNHEKQRVTKPVVEGLKPSSTSQNQGQEGQGGNNGVTEAPSPGLVRANELLSEGEKLGYKPGPPPGFHEFQHGRPHHVGRPRPPKRSRFPSILSSMFSWGGDENQPNGSAPPPPNNKGPRGGRPGGYPVGTVTPQSASAASEPFPVRIGTAIKGLFGGGGQRGHPHPGHHQHHHQQHPQQLQSQQHPPTQPSQAMAAGSSHFYSILPQEMAHPPHSNIRHQRHDTQGSPPTLASRPEIPFPSLTHPVIARRTIIIEVPQ